MANELGHMGIRINSINPTYTKTGRVEQLLSARSRRNQTSFEEEAAKVEAGIPLRRMGEVEEFGRVGAWLASPAASYGYGHALMFDSGATRGSL